MKLCVINFSISNGGDYLIEQRMNSLISHTWPNADIDFINGTKSYISSFEKYDAVICGGGPYYDDRIINELFIPLLGDAIDNIRLHIIGSGVYGNDYLDEAVYEKVFSASTMKFFKSIEKNNGSLCCRDVLSFRILNNNGIKNLYMTGCPAWYDFSFIDNTDCKYSGQVKKVVISDPGVTKNPEEQIIRAEQAIQVISSVRALFPHAEVIFTFNNGIDTKYSHKCNNHIKDYLIKEHMVFHDISGSCDGFKAYNDADLHIGFRVHSHIYSLSRRIPSVLIEEDMRGWGMNETFGLPHLLSFDISSQHDHAKYKPNKYLITHLNDMVKYGLETNFSMYKGTFTIMKDMYYSGYMKWANSIYNSHS